MIPEELNQTSALPACSVVIPTWNRADLLQETLASLEGQSYSNFDVIIVSDGEDETLRSVERNLRSNLALRWIFHVCNRGQGAARNTGAAAASGDFLLFLDDDTTPNPDLIARHMTRHLEAGPERKLAVIGRTAEHRQGPLPLPTDRFLQKSWENTIESYSLRLSAAGADSVGDDFDQIAAFGLNCSIRRTQFLLSGGFHEALRITDEDMELGLRLHLQGVEIVFEPNAVVTHRSTRNLTAYLQDCWQASGKLDVHRVFDLGQKNQQTGRLLALFHGYRLDRFVSRCKWHASPALLTLARLLEKAANRTDSRHLLAAWARTSQAGRYWSSVKNSGCSLEKLRSVAGRSRSALMLHSLAVPQSMEEASYYVSPSRFRRLMRWFHATGYQTATLSQWLRDEVPEKHVLLTFDDGYEDLYHEFLPIAIKYRLKALIFLVADRIGSENVWDQPGGLRARSLLTLEHIREMQRYGIEFGSHSLTHPWLPGVSDTQLRYEVTGSKRKLEDLLGVEINSFAYPYGGIDRRVRSAVANAGYRSAFTTLAGVNWWNDPLCQRRANVNNFTSLLDFTFMLRNGLGFTPTLGARIRKLQQDAPTRFLRSMLAVAGRIGHNTAAQLYPERRRDETH